MHYDIKALNYLVKADETKPGMYRAVLTDFGVCKILDGAVKVQGLTINMVKGRTQAYSPPELLKDEPIAAELWPARDVFAATVVLNELVTRELAWKDMSDSSIASAVLSGARPST